MIVKPFLTLIEAVGHSGSQSPQEVHKSALIFIAMIILIWTPPGLARDISCFGKSKSAAVLYPALLQTE
jgi:hypothetical protein